jgi:anti-anti-sigma factor
MSVTVDHNNKAHIFRVGGTRLHIHDQDFEDLKTAFDRELMNGSRKLALDLSTVTHIDSSMVGFLMDSYRQANAVKAELKIFGLKERVETMLTMTGVLNFFKAYPDEASAMAAFPELAAK